MPLWYDEKELANLRLMLETIDADAFLLPIRDQFSGGHQCSALAPGRKRVILGLVDGSLPNLESVNDIVTAVRMAPPLRADGKLSISPTCGFKVRDRERQRSELRDPVDQDSPPAPGCRTRSRIKGVRLNSL